MDKWALPLARAWVYPAVRRGCHPVVHDAACGCGGVAWREGGRAGGEDASSLAPGAPTAGSVPASPPARCRSGRCTPLARLRRFHQCQRKGERAGREGRGIYGWWWLGSYSTRSWHNARAGEQPRSRRVPTRPPPAPRTDRTGHCCRLTCRRDQSHSAFLLYPASHPLYVVTKRRAALSACADVRECCPLDVTHAPAAGARRRCGWRYDPGDGDERCGTDGRG
jgi:hypothetical protein